MYSYNTEVRKVLRTHPDGLTCAQINEIVKAPEGRIAQVVKTMPDAYIDRYLKGIGRGKSYIPVWCVVVPPENCPKPDRSKK